MLRAYPAVKRATASRLHSITSDQRASLSRVGSTLLSPPRRTQSSAADDSQGTPPAATGGADASLEVVSSESADSPSAALPASAAGSRRSTSAPPGGRSLGDQGPGRGQLPQPRGRRRREDNQVVVLRAAPHYRDLATGLLSVERAFRATAAWQRRAGPNVQDVAPVSHALEHVAGIKRGLGLADEGGADGGDDATGPTIATNVPTQREATVTVLRATRDAFAAGCLFELLLLLQHIGRPSGALGDVGGDVGAGGVGAAAGFGGHVSATHAHSGADLARGIRQVAQRTTSAGRTAAELKKTAMEAAAWTGQLLGDPSTVPAAEFGARDELSGPFLNSSVPFSGLGSGWAARTRSPGNAHVNLPHVANAMTHGVLSHDHRVRLALGHLVHGAVASALDVWPVPSAVFSQRRPGTGQHAGWIGMPAFSPAPEWPPHRSVCVDAKVTDGYGHVYITSVVERDQAVAQLEALESARVRVLELGSALSERRQVEMLKRQMEGPGFRSVDRHAAKNEYARQKAEAEDRYRRARDACIAAGDPSIEVIEAAIRRWDLHWRGHLSFEDMRISARQSRLLDRLRSEDRLSAVKQTQPAPSTLQMLMFGPRGVDLTKPVSVGDDGSDGFDDGSGLSSAEPQLTDLGLLSGFNLHAAAAETGVRGRAHTAFDPGAAGSDDDAGSASVALAGGRAASTGAAANLTAAASSSSADKAAAGAVAPPFGEASLEVDDEPHLSPFHGENTLALHFLPHAVRAASILRVAALHWVGQRTRQRSLSAPPSESAPSSSSASSSMRHVRGQPAAAQADSALSSADMEGAVDAGSGSDAEVSGSGSGSGSGSDSDPDASGTDGEAELLQSSGGDFGSVDAGAGAGAVAEMQAADHLAVGSEGGVHGAGALEVVDEDTALGRSRRGGKDVKQPIAAWLSALDAEEVQMLRPAATSAMEELTRDAKAKLAARVPSVGRVERPALSHAYSDLRARLPDELLNKFCSYGCSLRAVPLLRPLASMLMERLLHGDPMPPSVLPAILRQLVNSPDVQDRRFVVEAVNSFSRTLDMSCHAFGRHAAAFAALGIRQGVAGEIPLVAARVRVPRRASPAPSASVSSGGSSTGSASAAAGTAHLRRGDSVLEPSLDALARTPETWSGGAYIAAIEAALIRNEGPADKAERLACLLSEKPFVASTSGVVLCAPANINGSSGSSSAVGPVDDSAAVAAPTLDGASAAGGAGVEDGAPFSYTAVVDASGRVLHRYRSAHPERRPNAGVQPAPFDTGASLAVPAPLAAGPAGAGSQAHQQQHQQQLLLLSGGRPELPSRSAAAPSAAAAAEPVVASAADAAASDAETAASAAEPSGPAATGTSASAASSGSASASAATEAEEFEYELQIDAAQLSRLEDGLRMYLSDLTATVAMPAPATNALLRACVAENALPAAIDLLRRTERGMASARALQAVVYSYEHAAATSLLPSARNARAAATAATPAAAAAIATGPQLEFPPLPAYADRDLPQMHDMARWLWIASAADTSPLRWRSALDIAGTVEAAQAAAAAAMCGSGSLAERSAAAAAALAPAQEAIYLAHAHACLASASVALLRCLAPKSFSLCYRDIDEDTLTLVARALAAADERYAARDVCRWHLRARAEADQVGAVAVGQQSMPVLSVMMTDRRSSRGVGSASLDSYAAYLMKPLKEVYPTRYADAAAVGLGFSFSEVRRQPEQFAALSAQLQQQGASSLLQLPAGQHPRAVPSLSQLDRERLFEWSPLSFQRPNALPGRQSDAAEAARRLKRGADGAEAAASSAGAGPGSGSNAAPVLVGMAKRQPRLHAYAQVDEAWAQHAELLLRWESRHQQRSIAARRGSLSVAAEASASSASGSSGSSSSGTPVATNEDALPSAASSAASALSSASSSSPPHDSSWTHAAALPQGGSTSSGAGSSSSATAGEGRSTAQAQAQIQAISTRTSDNVLVFARVDAQAGMSTVTASLGLNHGFVAVEIAQATVRAVLGLPSPAPPKKDDVRKYSADEIEADRSMHLFRRTHSSTVAPYTFEVSASADGVAAGADAGARAAAVSSPYAATVRSMLQRAVTSPAARAREAAIAASASASSVSDALPSSSKLAFARGFSTGSGDVFASLPASASAAALDKLMSPLVLSPPVVSLVVEACCSESVGSGSGSRSLAAAAAAGVMSPGAYAAACLYTPWLASLSTLEAAAMSKRLSLPIADAAVRALAALNSPGDAVGVWRSVSDSALEALHDVAAEVSRYRNVPVGYAVEQLGPRSGSDAGSFEDADVSSAEGSATNAAGAGAGAAEGTSGQTAAAAAAAAAASDNGRIFAKSDPAALAASIVEPDAPLVHKWRGECLAAVISCATRIGDAGPLRQLRDKLINSPSCQPLLHAYPSLMRACFESLGAPMRPLMPADGLAARTGAALFGSSSPSAAGGAASAAPHVSASAGLLAADAADSPCSIVATALTVHAAVCAGGAGLSNSGGADPAVLDGRCFNTESFIGRTISPAVAEGKRRASAEAAAAGSGAVADASSAGGAEAVGSEESDPYDVFLGSSGGGRLSAHAAHLMGTGTSGKQGRTTSSARAAQSRAIAAVMPGGADPAGSFLGYHDAPAVCLPGEDEALLRLMRIAAAEDAGLAKQFLDWKAQEAAASAAQANAKAVSPQALHSAWSVGMGTVRGLSDATQRALAAAAQDALVRVLNGRHVAASVTFPGARSLLQMQLASTSATSAAAHQRHQQAQRLQARHSSPTSQGSMTSLDMFAESPEWNWAVAGPGQPQPLLIAASSAAHSKLTQDAMSSAWAGTVTGTGVGAGVGTVAGAGAGAEKRPAAAIGSVDGPADLVRDAQAMLSAMFPLWAPFVPSSQSGGGGGGASSGTAGALALDRLEGDPAAAVRAPLDALAALPGERPLHPLESTSLQHARLTTVYEALQLLGGTGWLEASGQAPLGTAPVPSVWEEGIRGQQPQLVPGRVPTLDGLPARPTPTKEVAQAAAAMVMLPQLLRSLTSQVPAVRPSVYLHKSVLPWRTTRIIDSGVPGSPSPSHSAMATNGPWEPTLGEAAPVSDASTASGSASAAAASSAASSASSAEDITLIPACYRSLGAAVQSATVAAAALRAAQQAAASSSASSSSSSSASASADAAASMRVQALQREVLLHISAAWERAWALRDALQRTADATKLATAFPLSLLAARLEPYMAAARTAATAAAGGGAGAAGVPATPGASKASADSASQGAALADVPASLRLLPTVGSQSPRDVARALRAYHGVLSASAKASAVLRHGAAELLAVREALASADNSAAAPTDTGVPASAAPHAKASNRNADADTLALLRLLQASRLAVPAAGRCVGNAAVAAQTAANASAAPFGSSNGYSFGARGGSVGAAAAGVAKSGAAPVAAPASRRAAPAHAFPIEDAAPTPARPAAGAVAPPSPQAFAAAAAATPRQPPTPTATAAASMVLPVRADGSAILRASLLRGHGELTSVLSHVGAWAYASLAHLANGGAQAADNSGSSSTSRGEQQAHAKMAAELAPQAVRAFCLYDSLKPVVDAAIAGSGGPSPSHALATAAASPAPSASLPPAAAAAASIRSAAQLDRALAEAALRRAPISVIMTEMILAPLLAAVTPSAPAPSPAPSPAPASLRRASAVVAAPRVHLPWLAPVDILPPGALQLLASATTDAASVSAAHSASGRGVVGVADVVCEPAFLQMLPENRDNLLFLAEHTLHFFAVHGETAFAAALAKAVGEAPPDASSSAAVAATPGAGSAADAMAAAVTAAAGGAGLQGVHPALVRAGLAHARPLAAMSLAAAAVRRSQQLEILALAAAHAGPRVTRELQRAVSSAVAARQPVHAAVFGSPLGLGAAAAAAAGDGASATGPSYFNLASVVGAAAKPRAVKPTGESLLRNVALFDDGIAGVADRALPPGVTEPLPFSSPGPAGSRDAGASAAAPGSSDGASEPRSTAAVASRVRAALDAFSKRTDGHVLTRVTGIADPRTTAAAITYLAGRGAIWRAVRLLEAHVDGAGPAAADAAASAADGAADVPSRAGGDRLSGLLTAAQRAALRQAPGLVPAAGPSAAHRSSASVALLRAIEAPASPLLAAQQADDLVDPAPQPWPLPPPPPPASGPLTGAGASFTGHSSASTYTLPPRTGVAASAAAASGYAQPRGPAAAAPPAAGVASPRAPVSPAAAAAAATARPATAPPGAPPAAAAAASAVPGRSSSSSSSQTPASFPSGPGTRRFFHSDAATAAPAAPAAPSTSAGAVSAAPYATAASGGIGRASAAAAPGASSATVAPPVLARKPKLYPALSLPMPEASTLMPHEREALRWFKEVSTELAKRSAGSAAVEPLAPTAAAPQAAAAGSVNAVLSDLQLLASQWWNASLAAEAAAAVQEAAMTAQASAAASAAAAAATAKQPQSTRIKWRNRTSVTGASSNGTSLSNVSASAMAALLEPLASSTSSSPSASDVSDKAESTESAAPAAKPAPVPSVPIAVAHSECPSVVRLAASVGWPASAAPRDGATASSGSSNRSGLAAAVSQLVWACANESIRGVPLQVSPFAASVAVPLPPTPSAADVAAAATPVAQRAVQFTAALRAYAAAVRGGLRLSPLAFDALARAALVLIPAALPGIISDALASASAGANAASSVDARASAGAGAGVPADVVSAPLASIETTVAVASFLLSSNGAARIAGAAAGGAPASITPAAAGALLLDATVQAVLAQAATPAGAAGASQARAHGSALAAALLEALRCPLTHAPGVAPLTRLGHPTASAGAAGGAAAPPSPSAVELLAAACAAMKLPASAEQLLAPLAAAAAQSTSNAAAVAVGYPAAGVITGTSGDAEGTKEAALSAMLLHALPPLYCGQTPQASVEAIRARCDDTGAAILGGSSVAAEGSLRGYSNPSNFTIKPKRSAGASAAETAAAAAAQRVRLPLPAAAATELGWLHPLPDIADWMVGWALSNAARRILLSADAPAAAGSKGMAAEATPAATSGAAAPLTPPGGSSAALAPTPAAAAAAAAALRYRAAAAGGGGAGAPYGTIGSIEPKLR